MALGALAAMAGEAIMGGGNAAINHREAKLDREHEMAMFNANLDEKYQREVKDKMKAGINPVNENISAQGGGMGSGGSQVPANLGMEIMNAMRTQAEIDRMNAETENINEDTGLKSAQEAGERAKTLLTQQQRTNLIKDLEKLDKEIIKLKAEGKGAEAQRKITEFNERNKVLFKTLDYTIEGGKAIGMLVGGLKGSPMMVGKTAKEISHKWEN